jgi:hypothetical protein
MSAQKKIFQPKQPRTETAHDESTRKMRITTHLVQIARKENVQSATVGADRLASQRDNKKLRKRLW